MLATSGLEMDVGITRGAVCVGVEKRRPVSPSTWRTWRVNIIWAYRHRCGPDGRLGDLGLPGIDGHLDKVG